ncbi:DsbA family oxidoreductase [Aestuariirhabdus litorea]|uniref:Disulfide bond formation protein DsbA n=1 Tax=Aestuariirhabdus litorea TaxID=2528527 RepID=A0A3P3VSI1_9GAMM|nr:DsbA family protein [Aestuariirhabdus litorea]RRJ83753.1 disulfide bond formation protein DsbA [Aestuariirhabdus litorea]RWW96976.1 disulfide bond formation protein DsbA [Endozoicomonadaceae bacterium GTF-13]
MSQPLPISYFSDTLCVWAYVSQIRLDELRANLGDQIELSYHFISLFGCTPKRLAEGWKDRGGYAGFNEHVLGVGAQFDHVRIHPQVWKECRPYSSAMSHLFLKAVQLLERGGEISDAPQEEFNGRTLFEETAWQVRVAFFEQARDIGRREVLLGVAEQMQLPLASIEHSLNSGEAMAELFRDQEMKESFRLEGSPTYLLDNGRQKLYGNVGYRIIEANVQELLKKPQGQASWC